MQKNNHKSLVFSLRTFTFCLLLFTFAFNAYAQSPDLAKIFADSKNVKGKRPIILIPGILGSELVNDETGEKVWFSLRRSKVDDLRLPIVLDLKYSRDNLIANDILRKVKVSRFLSDYEVYKSIIQTLKNYGGYEESSWDTPPKRLEDKFFVFPYDWRQDNVRNARLLIQKIEELKRKSKKPNIKFNVIAHSMGGLITRYAAMYGNADLPRGKPRPTWVGLKHFNKAFLLGTPNEGAASAFQTLLDGYGAVTGVNLPFVQDLTAIEVFTMPSLFQLMPHRNTYNFYDENLKSLKVNIYDPRVWKKYNWSIYGEKNLSKYFTTAEIGRLESYLELVLLRAKKFHEAINAKSSKGNNFNISLIGSDCSNTLDGFVIYKDARLDKWVTLTRPRGFNNSKGIRITSREVRKLMLSPGDGRVSRRSFLAKKSMKNGGVKSTNPIFICEAHDKLTGNAMIQNNILTHLLNESRP